MISWRNFLEEVIDDFKIKGYIFNLIEEMNIITMASKLDMTNDFYIKHNMHAVEWKLNAMINENKSLINKFNRNCRHPLNRKFGSYRVWSFNQTLKLTLKIYSNLSQTKIHYYLEHH